MKKVVIAFDVDGTLINDRDEQNINIVNLLITLAGFKNVQIIVWSGGGVDYAEMWVRRLGLTKYVKRCYSKNHRKPEDQAVEQHIFEPEIVPDIAIDDIHHCELGRLNLIVREK